MFFVDVILPFQVEHTFTYLISKLEYDFLKTGMRVAVPFGKSRIVTSFVYKTHTEPPLKYKAKEIYQILDDQPVFNNTQLQHWEWIATYYMCTLGEVVRAAIPSSFILESETEIHFNAKTDIENLSFTDEEYLLIEALQTQPIISVKEASEIIHKKNILSVLKSLIDKEIIATKEQLYERYKPKLIKYIRISPQWEGEAKIKELTLLLERAKKQRQLILTYFKLAATQKEIKVSTLLETSDCNASNLKPLIDKKIVEIYFIQTDRVNLIQEDTPLKPLSLEQKKAFTNIQSEFSKSKPVLLHGITGSGKTEVYAHLIEDTLKQGKQVLYLIPEIALTVQTINRLQQYFSNHLSAYHSKYSLNERVEIWNNRLLNKPTTQLIVGARSSIFLPFTNLGLIIIDEEHDSSYKQFNPAPRYHGRDAAIMLSRITQAKVILGTATPSVESYFNAVTLKKYALIPLNKRFGSAVLPEISIVNLKEKYKKKEMNFIFSDTLINHINEALEKKEQIILFQNRRGFAPVLECGTCGIYPTCTQCDVSLTYHRFRNELQCHYCGYKQSIPRQCGACGNTNLSTKGFGTEQVEILLQQIFEKATIERMDLDTTRGKYSYQKIVERFHAQEVDILIGTQMLSKGLNFENVSLVGILKADSLLNFPDFRAHERSFQLLTQVAGRAGRSQKKGTVIIQTFNPYHQIIKQVSTNQYLEMYEEQLYERHQFHYPPFYKLIKITLKHKNFETVQSGAKWLGDYMAPTFKNQLLGPSTPPVARIKNQFIQNLMIKIPNQQSLVKSKKIIQQIKIRFQSISAFRSIHFIIDVDFN